MTDAEFQGYLGAFGQPISADSPSRLARSPLVVREMSSRELCFITGDSEYGGTVLDQAQVRALVGVLEHWLRSNPGT